MLAYALAITLMLLLLLILFVFWAFEVRQSVGFLIVIEEGEIKITWDKENEHSELKKDIIRVCKYYGDDQGLKVRV